MKRCFFLLLTVVFVLATTASAQMAEKVDTIAINKIKDEGMNRSKVTETLSWLTDVYGPRLTASTEYRQAADWASSKMKEWGLQNVHFEKWGTADGVFGRGWSLKKFNASVLSPRAFPLISYPKAWSTGLKGTISGDVVYLDAKTEEDLQKYKGQLKGKFVLVSDPRPIMAHFTPEGSRIADSLLLRMANSAVPTPGPRGNRFPNFTQIMGLPAAQRDSAMRAAIKQLAPDADEATIRRMLTQFSGPQMGTLKLLLAQNEGAAAVLDMGRGDGGTIFVQQASAPYAQSIPAADRKSVYNEKAPRIVPQVTVAGEHYNRMIRMIQKGQKLKMEMELDVEFTKADSSFNVIAEIPGTDLKDEVVMIGAHFDSWHGGTGATDNATGSAVCMEALRILQAAGLQPRRTIRIGLWGGEEQGLLGSRGYVAQHFAEMEGGGQGRGAGGGGGQGGGELKYKPEHEKFSVYFNNDNGTGKVRGVYMQGNEAARSIFRSWLAPFARMGAQTLSLENTGGTDHLSFDGVGLPGFQFIQDPIEYDTRTHHSNMDVWDRAQEEDLKQASVIMASFTYNAAMRDAKFPRKEAPQPRPRQVGGN